MIDDFGMRKLPLTAAGDLLEIVMRRYERPLKRPVQHAPCRPAACSPRSVMHVILTWRRQYKKKHKLRDGTN
jgi:hypothetical protein